MLAHINFRTSFVNIRTIITFLSLLCNPSNIVVVVNTCELNKVLTDQHYFRSWSSNVLQYGYKSVSPKQDTPNSIMILFQVR